MEERLVGFRGMDPEGMIDLFTKIVKLTKVKKDRDHFRIFDRQLFQNTGSDALGSEKAAGPLPRLIQSAKTLERASADLIVIPHVTAHYFVEKFQAETIARIPEITGETVE